MAPVYYGEAYDTNKHFNALPPSARKVFFVNNYLIPTEMTEEVLKNFRLRMNIAPNSVGNFSTDSYLIPVNTERENIQLTVSKWRTDICEIFGLLKPMEKFFLN